MSRPQLVESRLGDEEVVATVNLAGEDTLVVTPTRSLLYRAEGLISDESVEEFPHEVQRLTLDEGRRKTKIRFEYPIQDSQTMSVPGTVLNSVLHYLLAGALNARGVTAGGEAVRRVFRFNELTLVITDRRLVTHVGGALWDDEYDQFDYDELSGLEFEDGSLATQIVLYTGGRSQRIKAPNDQAAELKQELTGALVDHFGVTDPAELDEVLGQSQAESGAARDTTEEATGLILSGDIEPIDPGGREDDDAPAEVEWPSTSDTEPVSSAEQADQATSPAHGTIDRSELETALRDLEQAIDAHRKLLDAQAEAVEALVAALESDR